MLFVFFFLAVLVFQVYVDLLHSVLDKMESQSFMCIFLMTRDAEHFWKHFLPIFSSFENSLFRSQVQFVNESFVFDYLFFDFFIYSGY